MINMAYRPFCTTGLNSLQSFTLIAQFLTLFVGIMIVLTKATAVSEEDGGGGVNKFEATVVAFVITVINVATMGWPFIRKLIGGDYFTYLKWATIILYKLPIRVYNKVFGVGGWFGRKKAARSVLTHADLIFGCGYPHTYPHQYIH